MSMLLEKRAYVVNGGIYVLCPVCGVGMRGTVNNNKLFCVKVKCKFCHEKFILELEHRKYYRKKIMSIGQVFCASKGAFTAIVKDISAGGIRFKCTDCVQHLHIDETVRIQFQIDDKMHSVINVMVQICYKYTDDEFGAIFISEFSSSESMKKIGFWLR